MTEFNFTIRATDDIGAYSERDFSIKVNNTQVNQFVATTVVGDILTSIDGITWARQQNVLSSTNSIYGDVINGNGFWLIAEARGTYLRSVDGLTWTRYNWPSGFVWSASASGSISAGENRQFTYGNGKIAASLLDSNSSYFVPVFFSTEDGINWEQGGNIFAAMGSSTSYSGVHSGMLAYGNGIWLANYNKTNTNLYGSTSQATTNNSFLFKSEDNGLTWTQVLNPEGLANNVGSSSVNFINGLWIIGTGSTNYYISADTLIWQTIPNPHEKPGYFYIATMTYNNGRLISWPELYVGGSAAVVGPWNFWYTSLDGINWTKSTNTYNMIQSSTATLSTGDFSVGSNFSNSYLQKISIVSSNGITVIGANRTNQSAVGGLGYSTDFGNTFTSANVTNNGTTTTALISGLAALRQVDI